MEGGEDSMRYGPEDKFWVVIDPTPESEMGDILFEASIRDLDLQFKGGLTMDRNPAIITQRKEAEVEAFNRLLAKRVVGIISDQGASAILKDASKVQLLDENGIVLFEANV